MPLSSVVLSTIKQASISATFDEEMAKRMLASNYQAPSNGSKSNRTKSKRTVGRSNFTIAWVYRQHNVEIPAEKESSVIELAETAKK